LTRNRDKIVRVVLLGLVVGLSAGGCAKGQGAMTSPHDAQQAAIRLLEESERQADLAWPTTPSPSAERCESGVRFGYYVPVKVETDTKQLAETFQRFWESKGLTVSPSETDFGQRRGILYSATADKEGAPSAAYQISDTTVVIRVVSQCAEGSLDDYEQ